MKFKTDSVISLTLLYSFSALLFCTLWGCTTLPWKSAPDDPIARAALEGDGTYDLTAGPTAEKNQGRDPAQAEKSLRNGDLILGMNQTEVLALWGKPTHKEVAGDPALQNERWVYTDGLLNDPTPHPPRLVYFDKGEVSGWDTGL